MCSISPTRIENHCYWVRFSLCASYFYSYAKPNWSKLRKWQLLCCHRFCFVLFCFFITSVIPSTCNMMAEGFRFMPLVLVRLRTFRLNTWVSKVQTWAQVLTRAQGGCVVHRCQIKIPEKGWPMDVNDVMHRKRARGGFCEFWKKLVELKTGHRTRRVDFRGGLGQVSHEMVWQMKKPE